MGLRGALFGGSPSFQDLRDPAFYADPFSEDLYWKLYVTFGGDAEPPPRPHSTLGWSGTFSRTTYQHHDRASVGDRRPVLLYGDSFAACSEGVVCFQDILNIDPEFSAGHYLLNYAVGGYGLDQILILLRNSLGLATDPFVVVSLFTYDLDRTVLSFRVGQKPRFRLVDGTLKPDPAPIYPHATDYLAENPPRAISYLYRKALFGGWLPASLSATLRGEERHRQQKIELSENILEEILRELRSRGLDFVFVVFHGERTTDNPLFGGTDWREEFLRRWLSERGVPYIWSKDIAAEDRKGGDPGSERYIDPEVLHPTEHFNRLIAREISEQALAATGPGAERQSGGKRAALSGGDLRFSAEGSLGQPPRPGGLVPGGTVPPASGVLRE